MSLLGNLMSGAIGAGLATIAKDYIQKQGGLQAIAGQFDQHGLGDTIKSWIGTGANLPISAEQIKAVLGSSALHPFAEKLGISPDDVSKHLAEYLPGMVDEMTPNGKVEDQSAA